MKTSLLLFCCSVLFLTSALPGCSDDPSGGDAAIADGGADASSDGPAADQAPSPPADALPAAAADAAVGDAAPGCPSTPLSLARVPGRVMLLLDQSSSMAGTDLFGLGNDHWTEVGKALTALLATPEAAELELGLDAFPDGSLSYFESCYDACCADPACLASQALKCTQLSMKCQRGCAVDLPPIVPLAAHAVAAPAILDYLGLAYLPGLFSSTPLVEQLRYYTKQGPSEVPALYRGDGASTLVVISDGEDTCFDTSETPDQAAIVAEITTLTQQLHGTHGLQVVALGFGDTSGLMADQLNAIAKHGGSPGSTFLPIDDPGELQAALAQVVASMPRCLYALQVPAGGLLADKQVVLLAGGSPLAEQKTGCVDGWRWSSASRPERPLVELCGPACDAVASGGAKLEARLDCPPQT